MSQPKNRRAFQRLPASSPVEMWTENHQWNGRLVNQSLGGIGLTIEKDVDQIRIGEEVRVEYDETEAVGFVRFIRAESDGGASLGIAWDQREAPRKDRRDDAMFFIKGPIEVVCQSCSIDSAKEQATFKLWDGAEFKESADQVISRSLSERKDLLRSKNLDDLSTLLKLYKLGDLESVSNIHDRLIDFEFTR